MQRSTTLRQRCVLRMRQLAVLALGPLAALVAAPVSAELPTVCAPCAGGFNWTAPGSISTYTVNGTQGLIQQRLERETFNWATFNISPGHTVEFRQPNASSVALNRIHQASPSEIFGALKANGQIYLVNQNGVLFKPGAQVDVNSLLASSLDLNDAIQNLFEEIGIVAAIGQVGNPAALVAGAAPPGAVQVEAGATIKAQENGRVILAGGDVVNAGTIDVSGIGGQALLVAAKDKIYLYTLDSAEASRIGMRGLAVEIDDGGSVQNLGRILAGQGNVTLAGLAVNQDGLIRATTAVAANGTIRLQAQDSVSVNLSGKPIAARAGSVSFGAGSTTEVVPDTATAATAVDELAQLRSRIDVRAEDVLVRGGATLRTPGGIIDVVASGAPDPRLASSDGSITVEAGAVLDAAGSRGATVSAARNIAEIELRGNELADAPVQRNGPLRGKKVRVDTRELDKIKIANVDAVLSDIQRGILERTASGGTISLAAGSRVSLARGALFDVSGGTVEYTAAFLDTTKLVNDGVVVDIADADPEVNYDAVLEPVTFTHRKWGPNTTEVFNPFGATPVGRFEPGYLEGKDAGTIDIGGLDVGQILNTDIAATFRATTERGFYQRESAHSVPTEGTFFERPFGEIALGGRLSIAQNSGSLSYSDAGGWPFVTEGINRFVLRLDSFAVEAGSTLELAPDGLLEIHAFSAVDIDGTIRSSGGTVDIAVNESRALSDGRLRIGSAGRIDLSGGFVNDSLLLYPLGNDEPLHIDGGKVDLVSGGALTLESGSAISVDGGLQLDDHGARHVGAGGSVHLEVGLPEGIADVPVLDISGTLSGHVFAGGDAHSSLSIVARDLRVQNGASGHAGGLFIAGSDLLTGNGFTDIELASNGGLLEVAPGTDVLLVPNYLELSVPRGAVAPGTLAAGNTLDALPSTTDVRAIAAPLAIADQQMRSPTALHLTARPFAARVIRTPSLTPPDALVVGAGAHIETDADGEITLDSTGGIRVEGGLRTPGGDISVHLGRVLDDATQTPDPTAGYDARRAITLGASAVLDASGTLENDLAGSRDPLFGNRGLVARRPLAAGDISLIAEEGFVLAAAGARLDVSGVLGTTIVATPSRTGAVTLGEVALASDAGGIDVEASNGIQLFADLRGAAGAGAAGGSLRVALNGDLRKSNSLLLGGDVFPENPLRVIVTAAGSAALAPGADLPTGAFGRADFSLAALTAGGFDYLELAAAPNALQLGPNTSASPLMPAQIEFVGDVSLALRGGITLDAPLLVSDGGVARLDAAHLSVGFRRQDMVSSDTPLPSSLTAEPTVKYFSANAGSGRLALSGELVDLVGFTALRGFGGAAAVDVRSSGDIRLVGVRSPVAAVRAGIDGAWVTAADTQFSAARIYPTTLTDFQILNQASGARVAFAGVPGGKTATPLSAGGRLSVVADTIVQGGQLFAPHGQIALDADSELVLDSGSLTSVSGGDATILFGRTQVSDWIFPFAEASYVFTTDPDEAVNEFAPPAKRVTLTADGVSGGAPTGRVDVRTGAVIDAQGGGSLLATEFVPGPGGSLDLALASLASDAAGLLRFAIVPTETLVAPHDPLESAAFARATGQRIRIRDGIAGLPAGTYAILPPRYALLPGAFLLTRDDSSAGALTLADGAATAGVGGLTTTAGLPVVQASFDYLGGDVQAAQATARYSVETGAQMRTRAEYRESDADSFFALQADNDNSAVPLLPRDAGSVEITPNAVLNLGGRLASGRPLSGRGSLVDIAANALTISADGSGGSGVNIRAADLEALNADSLFIGGRRVVDADGVRIDTLLADEIVVESDVRLSLRELLLGALERVEVRSGAELGASGAVLPATGELGLDGAGALLWLSTAELPTLLRENVPANSTAVASIGSAASLFGAGSLIIDSSGSTVIDGTIAAGAGGGIRLGAQQIALGATPSGAPGLRLEANRLEQLGVDKLVLSSVQPLDLYGEFTLTLDALEIDAPGMRGMLDGAQDVAADIRARSIVLGNRSGGLVGASGTGSGSLNLSSPDHVRPLELHLIDTAGLDASLAEDGDFDLSGFAQTTFDAPLLTATGVHAMQVAGSLALRADLIGALDGGSLSIAASDALSTTGSAGVPDSLPGALDLLGGAVSLSGATLAHDTAIAAPSGVVSLKATGGDLVLGSQALVDTGGLSAIDYTFARVGTPGGRVSLAAETGNIAIANGARFSVSAGRGDKQPNAGTLSVAAPQGSLTIGAAAVFDGSADVSARSAVARFDVNRFSSDFGALNRKLDDGGFRLGREFRVRGSGGLIVDTGTVVRASDIKLVVEQGTLDIHGTLDASNLRGGNIDVVAGGILNLHAGAVLRARATGGFFSDPAQPTVYDDGQRGGQIELAAPLGIVNLNGGLIDVTGTRVDSGGSLVAHDSGVVRVTAARNAGNNGLQMGPVGANLVGAHDIQFVGHKSYLSGATGSVVSEAQTFSNNAAAIRAALFEPDAAAPSALRIVPGVEIVNAGDLTVSTLPGVVAGTAAANTGLLASTIGAGVITYRAGGNLTVATNALLRDGITTEASGPNNVRFIADTLHAWSMQFVAGADLASADLLATGSGGQDLSFASGAQVVTGSGDINLAASGDISLASNARMLVVGRHFSTAENGGAYNFDGTINIPASLNNLNLQFLRGASFPDFGGHVTVTAGGTLTGASSTQYISDWHVRMGGRDRESTTTPGTVPRAWGLSFGPTTSVGQPAATTGTFNQGIGAWGGGNIAVRTGGDVNNIQLNVPTAGRQIGVNSWSGVSGQPWTTTTDVVDVLGGGDVVVDAVGSIRGLEVFVARGDAVVRAAGDILPFGSGAGMRANRFALGNTDLDLEAGGRIDIGSVVNDTTLALRPTHPAANPLFETFYFSYSARAGVSANALGEIRLSNVTTAPVAISTAANLYPSRLSLVSVRDDIVFEGDMRLFSNSTDGFVIAAGENVRSGASVGSLTQVDVRASLLPSFDEPARPNATIPALSGHSLNPVYRGDRTANVLVARDGTLGNVQLSTAKRLLAFAGEDILDPSIEVQHPNYGDLSSFLAGNDIRMRAARLDSGRLSGNSFRIYVSGPGEAQLIAGNDIDFGTGQGFRSIGDLDNPALPDQGADLLLIAGVPLDRLDAMLDTAIQNYLVDVMLPFNYSDSGPELVPPGALAPSGDKATLTVNLNAGALAGTNLAVSGTSDREAILARILRSDDGGAREREPGHLLVVAEDKLSSVDGLSETNRVEALVSRARRASRIAGASPIDFVVIRDNEDRVTDVLPIFDLLGVDPVDVAAELRDKSVPEQLSALLDVFYDELVLSGVEASANLDGRGGNFRRGYSAAAALFPQPDFSFDGNIASTLSTVQTQDGGSIRLAVPGGLIDVGATVNDAVTKADQELGHVVFRAGDYQAYAASDFNVNSTRVFTQNGGDLLIWSSLGDIDAGRGAKTAGTIPATVAVFDEFGNFVDDPPIAVSGSGIRTFAPVGVKPGILYLFAPIGTIDAGDAGIEAGGISFLFAETFRNANNINNSGPSIGNAPEASGGLAVGLAGAGDAAAGATKDSEKATRRAAEEEAEAQSESALAQPQLSIISVEVLSFGDTSSGSVPGKTRRRRVQR